jgi:hypothetical protein
MRLGSRQKYVFATKVLSSGGFDTGYGAGRSKIFLSNHSVLRQLMVMCDSQLLL